MDPILVLSNKLTKQQLLRFINSHSDFCAAIIDERLGKNFQLANVLLERRKNKIFILINRNGFGHADAQFMTWQGDYLDLLPLFESEPFSVAYMSITRFVARSAQSQKFTLLRSALESIHYRGAHLVLGEPEYMVKEVKNPAVKRAVSNASHDTSGEKQLDLF